MTTGNKTAMWIIGILVVAIGAYAYMSRDGGMLDNGTATTTDDMVACTMDAKMCPDGSYVGRSGPKCEFAACPSATTTTSKPTTTGTVSGSVNTSGTVQYPADWAK